eukprot:gene1074-2102_t
MFKNLRALVLLLNFCVAIHGWRRSKEKEIVTSRIGPVTPLDPNCKRVPWITCVGSTEAIRNEEYFTYLKAALLSARRFAPSVVPFVLFGGTPEDVPTWLATFDGVSVINHNLSFYSMLKRRGVHPKFAVQHGSYLRLDIPNAMHKLLPYINETTTETNYVLYTDVDVMFFDDVNSCMLQKPAIIAMGPEIERNSTTNSGVIYMNVSAMASELPQLLKFANSRKWQFRTYDQQLILDYGWSREVEQLSDELNWKGYWGGSNDVKIFHFHGLKPGQCLECFLTFRTLIVQNQHGVCVRCKPYRFLWKSIPDGGAFYEKTLHMFNGYIKDLTTIDFLTRRTREGHTPPLFPSLLSCIRCCKEKMKWLYICSKSCCGDINRSTKVPYIETAVAVGVTFDPKAHMYMYEHSLLFSTITRKMFCF